MHANAGRWFLLSVVLCSGCMVDGRARRTDAVVSSLAPAVHLGQPLNSAQEAVPSLLVRHRGDPPVILLPLTDDTPRIVQAIVVPEPLAGERAPGEAPISGFVFVMNPDLAAPLRQRITTMLGRVGTLACAGRSLAERDSVVVWTIDTRGGVILTYPEHRPAEITPVSRLFVYSGAWHPEQSISGYGRTDCNALLDRMDSEASLRS